MSEKPLFKKAIANPRIEKLNFASFSMKVIQYINLARKRPDQMASLLRAIEVIESDGRTYMIVNKLQVELVEKKAALDEAISYLAHSYSSPALEHSSGLTLCAEELLTILKMHEGMDNDFKEITITNKNVEIETRVNHYGAAFGELNELVDNGSQDPLLVVLNFLICDGDKERKERNILFNRQLGYIGIISGLLPSEKCCTVINLAEKFFNKGQAIPKLTWDKYNNSTTMSKFIKGPRENSESLRKYANDIMLPDKLKTDKQVNINLEGNVDLEDEENRDVFARSDLFKKYDVNKIGPDFMPKGVERVEVFERKGYNRYWELVWIIKKVIHYDNGMKDEVVYLKE